MNVVSAGPWEPCYDLRTMVEVWAARTPEKAVIKEGPLSLTYRALARHVEEVARGMQACGVGKGDRVVVALPNWHEAVAVFFATLKLGAVFVPCNKFSGAMEMRERVALTNPTLVFVGQPDFVDVLEEHGCAATVVSVRFCDTRCCFFEKLIALPGVEMPCPELDADRDTAAIIFTSGSTGAPKGVELTFTSLAGSARNYGRAMEVSGDDVFAMAMPLCHMFGIDAGVVLPIQHGATILLVDKFRSEKMLRLIEAERATVLYGAPTMFARQLEAARAGDFDLSSLRTGMIGGASCPEALIESVREELHCNVVIGYGSTEAGAISATSLEDPDRVRATTVGRAFDDVEVRVVDESGEPRRYGCGELVNRSECVMKGFFRQPERTAAALRDGWIHTGDLVEIDEDGLIRIIGRLDDMIIRGGYNIFGSEIEQVYSAHPAVMECCVVPIPDDDLGQRTCLAVRRAQPDTEIDPAALREYARGRLSKHKIPDYVVMLDELPKLSIGKFDRRQIQRLCVQRIEATGGVLRRENLCVSK